MNEQELVPSRVLLRFDEVLDKPQENTDLDAVLGSAVAAGERPATIRIWRSTPQPGLSLSRRDVSTPAGDRAAQALRASGYQVVVRQTGGTAVPQGDGVFHLTYLFPRQHPFATTDAYYRLLTSPLVSWMGSYGLDSRVGSLAGSYCDGSYNVLANECKVMGTAQAWRGGLAGVAAQRQGYVLAQACVTVDVNMAEALALINEFYTAAGQTYRVVLETAADLRHLAPHYFEGLATSAAVSVAIDDLVFQVTRYFEALGAVVERGS